MRTLISAYARPRNAAFTNLVSYLLSSLILQSALAQVPVINSFAPTSGPVGTTVTINGSNFSAVSTNNIVYVGGIGGVVNNATATSLAVTVPAGCNYQALTVTTNNLTAYSNAPFVSTFPGGGSFVPNSFTSRTDLAAGENPTDVEMDDLNNDGKADLIIGDNSLGYITVFKNTSTAGSISFATKVHFQTTSVIQDVAVGDLDGDGKLDMVACGGVAQLSILRNTSTVSTISFDNELIYGTGGSPSSVAICDLDGDGKPDIITGNYNAYSVSFHRNTSSAGNISFATRIDSTMGSYQPRIVVVSDFDGDGKPDVAVGSDLGGLSIFRNTSTPGTISFAKTQNFPANTNPYYMAAGDLNADQKPDIALVSWTSNKVSVYKNTSSVGTISLAARVEYPTGNYPESVAIADLNGDAKPDIAVGNLLSNTISLFEDASANGNMSFLGKVDYATGDHPHGVGLGDLDNDGKADIVVANINADSISIFHNQMGYALSVKLLTFTSTKKDNQAYLQWQTANEENTAYFDVERSGDNSSFSRIGRVYCSKDFGGSNVYDYTDANPINGTNFYRLKIVEGDGRSSCSQILLVNFANSERIRLYPNPVKDALTIEYDSPVANLTYLNIFDEAGRKLIAKSQQVTLGKNILSLNLSDLSNGTYTLQLVNKAERCKVKFMKE